MPSGRKRKPSGWKVVASKSLGSRGPKMVCTMSMKSHSQQPSPVAVRSEHWTRRATGYSHHCLGSKFRVTHVLKEIDTNVSLCHERDNKVLGRGLKKQLFKEGWLHPPWHAICFCDSCIPCSRLYHWPLGLAPDSSQCPLLGWGLVKLSKGD